MAKFTAISVEEVPPSDAYTGGCDVQGVIWSKKLSPDDYALWLAVSELADGAELRWDRDHGDQAVYVIDGALDVDGHRCPSDGAVVVESGVAARARAVGRTAIAHYAPVSAEPPTDGLYGAPKPDGHVVHVVGENGWFSSGRREGVVARWFADSTCPSCRISVFHVANPRPNAKDTPHHHTQDEIIYLLAGQLSMGAFTYGPGTALSIPAHMRYSLTGGPEGCSFLNYRRDVSVQHYAGDRQPELEGGIARGGDLVADFR